MSVLEALRPVLAEYGTLSGLSPTAFHTTHCGRTLNSSGIPSTFTKSNCLFGATCSVMYNAITPSVRCGAALAAAPQIAFLLLVFVHSRDVVEGTTVSLHVLDHEVVLAAHQVFDPYLLASLKLPAEYVLNPLAWLSLRTEVRGGVRVNFAPSVRSFQYFPAPPPILPAHSRSLWT